MKTLFFVLILIINNVAAQQLIKNKTFLKCLQTQYPDLVLEGNFLSPKAAKLKELNIQRSSIQDTLDLIGFDSLTSLNVSTNKIKCLLNLPNSLKNLNCSSNQLETLISPSLVSEINCRFNKLKKLTVKTKDNYIYKLYCDHNELEELNLFVERIIEFNCSHNQLKAINVPQDLRIDVDNANFSYNPWQKILVLKHSNTLNYEGVDLSLLDNFWDSLPYRLTELNCDYCNLDKLPELLPRNLSKFNCKGNKLKSLPKHLPSNLTLLDCRNNLITELPEFLPYYLQSLYCANNQLTQLPEHLPNGMYELNCQHNKISKLPELLPLNLHVLNCSNNLITEIMPLPCRVKEINADSNLIQNVGDLPLSLQSLSLVGNPILKRDLLQEGWFKNSKGDWIKRGKKYNCGFGYAVKSHCDSCTIGYQLTDNIKKLERLDLTEFDDFLSFYGLKDSLDLSNFEKLKVFIAESVKVDVLTFPQSIQLVKMFNGGVEKTLGFTNNLRYLNVSTLENIAQPLPDSLRYLTVTENRMNYYKPDSLKYMPPTLKWLDLEDAIRIAPNIKWPQSLENLSYTGVLPQQVLPNLKRLKFTNEATQLEPIFKQYTALKYLEFNGTEFNNLYNLPPNLDSLIISGGRLDTITSMSFGDSLHYLKIKTNLSALTTVKAANLTKIDFEHSSIQKRIRFNTPNLIALNLSSNELETLPSVLPKSLQFANFSHNPLSYNKLIKINCKWWRQLDKDAAICVLFRDEKIAKKLRKKTKNNPCINNKLRIYLAIKKENGRGYNIEEVK